MIQKKKANVDGSSSLTAFVETSSSLNAQQTSKKRTPQILGIGVGM